MRIFLTVIAVILAGCISSPPLWASGSGPLELDLEVRPIKAAPGQRIEIRVNLINRGRSALKPGPVTILAQGERIEGFEPPSLKAGESYLRRFSWKAEQTGRVRIEARLDRAASVERWVEITARAAGKRDLALAWLATPPKGCLGQGPWTAQVGVVNKGTLPSTEGNLLFLVNGQTADQARIPVLEPGQQLLISFIWRGAREGSNSLTAELDQEAALGDIDSANNRITQKFIFKKCRPDLALISLKLSGRAEPGRRPAKAAAVVANLGGVAAEAFTVRFLIDGRETASFSEGRLDPGRRRTIRTEWMPSEPGTYRLTAEVETRPGTGELETANNRREITFTTLDDQPDLIPTRPDLPLNICFGKGPVLIGTEVVNRGRKTSDRTEVVIRRETEVVAREVLKPLPPGGSVSLKLEWKPRGPGSYRLFLVVDPEGMVGESNRNNNTALFQVRLRDCRPDLIVSSVKVADRIGPEKSTRRILFSVHNKGGSVSAKTKAAVLVDGKQVDELEIGPIQPAASQQFGTFLPDLREGEHSLRIVVAPDGEIEEINQGNNDQVRRIEARSSPVDLRVLTVTTEPETPLAGQPFFIIARVANLGAAVGRVEVAFKLDGREIARKFLSALWTKAEKTIRLDAGKAPGKIVSIEAVVDPDNLIKETDEDNNSARREMAAER